MSDRAATPPVPGLLTNFVGPPVVALTVAYFSEANTLSRASFRLVDPPSGGQVVVELNTEADGTGDEIEVTILDGDDFATMTGAVAIAADSHLYQRITAESGMAMSLSGEYELTSTGSAVATMLTTLQNVKLDDDIDTVDSNRDLLLNAIISGVSRKMTDWMDRGIVQSTTVREKISTIGRRTITLQGYPILAITELNENGDPLTEGDDFEMDPHEMEAGLVARVSGGDSINWPRGNRHIEVTYDHGFATIPPSIERAATAQVVNDYHETRAANTAWRGLLSKGVDPSSSITFDKEVWTRDTIPAMEPYRRRGI